MTNATRLPSMFGLVLLGLVLYHSVASAQACPPPIAEERTTREIPSSMIVADSIGFCPGADRVSEQYAIDGNRNPWSGPFRDHPVDVTPSPELIRCGWLIDDLPVTPAEIEGETILSEKTINKKGVAGWQPAYAEIIMDMDISSCCECYPYSLKTPIPDTTLPSTDIAPSPIAGYREQYIADGVTVFWHDEVVALPFTTAAPARNYVSLDVLWTGATSCRFGPPQRESVVDAIDDVALSPTNTNAVDRIDTSSTPAADPPPADWVAISHNNDTIDYRWDSLTLFAPPIDGQGRSIAEGLTIGGYHVEKLGEKVEEESTILFEDIDDRTVASPTSIVAEPLPATWIAISPHGDTINYGWDSLTLFDRPVGDHSQSLAEAWRRSGYRIVKRYENGEDNAISVDRSRRDTTGRFVTIHDVYPQSALLTSFTLPLIVPHGDVADPETIASPDPILVISSGAQTDPVAKDEEHAATSVAIPHAPGLD